MADCGGAAYARENGIPVVLFPRSKEEPEGLSADDLITVLRFASALKFVLQTLPQAHNFHIECLVC